MQRNATKDGKDQISRDAPRSPALGAPKEVTLLGGEVVDLAKVPEHIRQVATAISFAAGEGPWWSWIPTAREVTHIVYHASANGKL